SFGMAWSRANNDPAFLNSASAVLRFPRSTVSNSKSLACVTSFLSSTFSYSLGCEKTAAHEEFSSPSPLGNGKGKAFSDLKTRLSRLASAARLLPTISSPSLGDEGRNRDVGRQRCRSGGAVRSMHATRAGRDARNQSNRVTDALPRRERCQVSRGG